LDTTYQCYYSGKLAISPDRMVHATLMVSRIPHGNYHVYYTSSSDHGSTWSNRTLVDDDSARNKMYPDIAVDAEGRAYLAWQDQRNHRDEVWFSTNAPLGIAEQPMKTEFSRELGVEPNPFVRSASVLWQSSSSLAEAVRVFAQDGRLVRQARVPAGEERWVWDGRDDSSAPLPPGVYVIDAGPGLRSKVVKLR